MKRQRYALPLSMGLFGAALCSATPSWADSGHGHGPVRISGLSPYGALTNCGNFPGVVVTPGVNYVNTEIEPWVEVNPTNHDNIVAFWQQDRWSNGGSRGLVAGVSGDGGETWQSVVVPGLTDCSGGTYERATDPWLSFSPDGTLHQISLAFDIDPPPDVPNLNGPNALLVSKSSDGGLHWSEPISIFEDTDPNFFSDKQSITADPTDSISSTRSGIGWKRSTRISTSSRARPSSPVAATAATPGNPRAWSTIRAATIKPSAIRSWCSAPGDSRS
ncbi:MAG: sialidase family protein [Gammaproteobacteria bacterium]